MINKNSTQPKRHCMVVHAHYPKGETRVQRQAEALVRYGFEVDVLCLRGENEPEREDCNGVQVLRLPVKYQNHPRMTGKLLEYVRFFFQVMLKLFSLHLKRRYQTVQVHNLPDFLVFAAWWPKLLGAKVVLDLHDMMPEFFKGHYGGQEGSWVIRLLYLQENLACRFANHVILVSKLWQKTLEGRAPVAHKCSIVMNVADHTIFNNPKNPDALTKNGAGLRLIYHGSMNYRYGIDLILKAVAQVRPQIPDIHLTLHGGGAAFPEYIKLAESLDLTEKNLCFSTKSLPVEALPDLIKSGDVGLGPYRNDPFTDEIVPTKLMEYAALGMPTIASRTSAIKAYFENTMVEFFEPGDVDDLARCILYLNQNRTRLAELARGAKTFNDQYNWEKVGQAYVQLIEQLGS